jgi:hypothetical protein
MRVAVPPRSLLSLILGAVARVASADPTPEPPLWDAEVRAGYGVELDGGQGPTGTRPSPLTVQALVDFAVIEQPHVYAVGGVMAETIGRSSIGGMAGVELRPDGSPLHLGAGAVYIVAPYTLWGAMASGGYCRQQGKMLALCGDLQLTAYFAGTDLPMKRDATQVQLAFGVKFDAL